MTQVSNVIFLFGAPCSGKSTLRMALQKHLGREWTSIDQRAVIARNKLNELAANNEIDLRILFLKTKIIIEAKIPWRPKREGEFYFILSPPSEVLEKRDDLRIEKLHRPLLQAVLARDLMGITHSILSRMEEEEFDRRFDSSTMSVMQEVDAIKSVIQIPAVENVAMISAAIKPKTHTKYLQIVVAGVVFSIACVLFYQSQDLP
jgi:hypothetical protein